MCWLSRGSLRQRYSTGCKRGTCPATLPTRSRNSDKNKRSWFLTFAVYRGKSLPVISTNMRKLIENQTGIAKNIGILDRSVGRKAWVGKVPKLDRHTGIFFAISGRVPNRTPQNSRRRRPDPSGRLYGHFVTPKTNIKYVKELIISNLQLFYFRGLFTCCMFISAAFMSAMRFFTSRPFF